MIIVDDIVWKLGNRSQLHALQMRHGAQDHAAFFQRNFAPVFGAKLDVAKAKPAIPTPNTTKRIFLLMASL